MACRREERLQDAPVAVTALGGEALREANVIQLQQLQEKVPGLAIRLLPNGLNALQLTIRGQRQFGPISPRTRR